MNAVTNSGPLIVLAKLNHLRLLSAMYDTVIVPQAVYDEVVTVGLRHGYPDANVADAFLRRMKWSPVAVTLGILIGAYRRGFLSADALDELLAAIENRDDIWIHPEMCRRARREVLGR